eukprot:CAMPEP_0172592146 /NCGR_PEP_ID=MMETSP1068-20121228/11003_1 /TAXON_ID=35684 /ORGANISM="Pseudopedinella elastica, Strain CCMP716" /LENGTH=64 /DNA_ID=CAMNT_0013388969 /DNA_START=27 /DNA_END=219 /DNA_ORIENTATION=+
MSKPALSRMRGLARPHNYNPQSPNLRDSGPSAPGAFSMMPDVVEDIGRGDEKAESQTRNGVQGN